MSLGEKYILEMRLNCRLVYKVTYEDIYYTCYMKFDINTLIHEVLYIYKTKTKNLG